MRIVLCDDDKDVLNLLEKYLQEYFSSCRLAQPVYSEYMSGEELLRTESRGGMEKVDIAFLDVEMLGLSGIHNRNETADGDSKRGGHCHGGNRGTA